MIITGGSNVYAVEVEAALADHAAVRDVAVVGLADRTWGELVVAVVVADDPNADTEAALSAHCAHGARRLQAAAPLRLSRRPPPQRVRQGPETRAARRAGRDDIGI